MPASARLLDLPGGVAADGADAPVAAHYGSFNGEQTTLESGAGFVDLSHREVLRISGPDRLSWLHSLTSQTFEGLAPDVETRGLVLSPQGHIEHAFVGTDDGEAFTLHTEPGAASGLRDFLERMRFMLRVEVADLSADLAVGWRPGHGFDLVPRERFAAYAEAAGPPCGLWAYDALRIARGGARIGWDTDHRTIPNEIGLAPWVHLDKGCYRGQETVARVDNLGRPPRRLTLLHLDGSENRLPEVGAEVLPAGAPEGARPVGRVGTSARHHELGPISLALLKRGLPVGDELLVDRVAAAQEVVVDPEVGKHFRPQQR